MEEMEEAEEESIPLFEPILSVEPIRRAVIRPGHGHCPFPSQTVIDNYIKNYTYVVQNSTGLIHTEDRHFWQAIQETLGNKLSNDTWASTVQTKFLIDFWPFIQSNQTYTCVNAVTSESPRNLFKTAALRLTRDLFVPIASVIMLYSSF